MAKRFLAKTIVFHAPSHIQKSSQYDVNTPRKRICFATLPEKFESKFETHFFAIRTAPEELLDLCSHQIGYPT